MDTLQALPKPYRLLRRLPDSQVGASFLGSRLGVDGFEKTVVLRFGPARLARTLVTEARRAASLSHASLERVLGAEVQTTGSFVVCDYTPAVRVHDLVLRDAQLDWRVAAAIAADVADGLAHAHARRNQDGRLLRLVHTRLSPRRIEITDTGHVRVTGFGSAWAWPDHRGYGAPEEARREPIDGRADLYSLGLLLDRCTEAARRPARFQHLIQSATHRFPEQRPAGGAFRDGLLELLDRSENRITSSELAALTRRYRAHSPWTGDSSSPSAGASVSTSTSSSSSASACAAASASAAAASAWTSSTSAAAS